VLYIGVAKVDWDGAYVVKAIHVCFKCMFQMFHLFQHMLQVFYLDVAYTCMLQTYVFKFFQVFVTYVGKCVIWMLHMFRMVFKCFLGVFASVSNACFDCFICLILYVATITSGCFKKIGCYTWDACEKWLAARATFRAAWATSGATRATSKAVQAHCRCARSRTQRALALARSLCGHLPDASAQIGRPGASKSVLKNLLQFNIVHMCSEYARNAWHKLGAMPTEEAMQEYITIVQELFPTGIQVQVR
jgi:hypothetical protein